MILDEFQITRIVQQLLNKTMSGQVRWQLASGSYYLGLPDNTMIALLHEKDAPSDAYVLRIVSPTNDLLGELRAAEKDGFFPQLKMLYEQIQEQVSTDLFDQILQEVSQEGVIGKTTSHQSYLVVPNVVAGVSSMGRTRSETSFRARPSPEQVDRLLSSLSGSWMLEEEDKKTNLIIDRKGGYYVRSQSQPEFRLVILACNDDLTRAEVAKDLPDGKRFRIEVLDIDSAQMKGVVKHTGASIQYIRTGA
jgi:hypothetical protein